MFRALLLALAVASLPAWSQADRFHQHGEQVLSALRAEGFQPIDVH